MLATMREILDDARKNNYAVGCINTPTMDMLRAIVGAAEDVGTPIIIDHAEVHDSLIPIEAVAPYMLEFARKARVPVAVHVDHGSDFRFIMRGIRSGFNSVMYDLSSLPYEENLARVTEFAAMAHSVGISVEGELGVMTSNLHDSHGGAATPVDIRETFTDPDAACSYAKASGVDALAVCFGTVHGMYIEEPELDLDHLKALRAAVPDETHLVMHGSSGVDFDQITEAINAGATKINYYSYLSAEASRHTAQLVAQANGPIFYHDLTEATTAHLRTKTAELLRVFVNGHTF